MKDDIEKLKKFNMEQTEKLNELYGKSRLSELPNFTSENINTLLDHWWETNRDVMEHWWDEKSE